MTKIDIAKANRTLVIKCVNDEEYLCIMKKTERYKDGEGKNHQKTTVELTCPKCFKVYR